MERNWLEESERMAIPGIMTAERMMIRRKIAQRTASPRVRTSAFSPFLTRFFIG